MSKAPGHEAHPDHKVIEKHIPARIRATFEGEAFADSTRVIEVQEDRHPSRYYFPRADVRMDLLERSATTTKCPFKGTAHYFHLLAGGRKYEDAAWTYEDPYDEHRDLAGRVAFYADNVPGLAVQPAL
jgi:uncharacterized protein (DUF427 family)